VQRLRGLPESFLLNDDTKNMKSIKRRANSHRQLEEMC
jgi:hypothetical protein